MLKKEKVMIVIQSQGWLRSTAMPSLKSSFQFGEAAAAGAAPASGVWAEEAVCFAVSLGTSALRR
ncbi:hypothetical protein D3C73_1637650 [compost metagenome]